jgi:hypothetical protein
VDKMKNKNLIDLLLASYAEPRSFVTTNSKILAWWPTHLRG